MGLPLPMHILKFFDLKDKDETVQRVLGVTFLYRRVGPMALLPPKILLPNVLLKFLTERCSIYLEVGSVCAI